MEESTGKKSVSKRLSNKANAENLGGSTSFPASKGRTGNTTDSEVSHRKGLYPFRRDLLKLRGEATPPTNTITPATKALAPSNTTMAVTERVIAGTSTTGSKVATTSSVTTGEEKTSETKPLNESDEGMQSVEGRLFFEYGLPATNLSVRLYSRNFGGTESLVGESKTDNEGYYSVTYDPKGKSTNLEVHLLDEQGNEITLSETKINVDKKEELNLIAPKAVRPLSPEYSRIVIDIEKDIGSVTKLVDAEEKDDRRDISILHESTGWDARLIALLVKAAKLSTETGIDQEVLYALYRMGFPTDKQLLASTDINAAVAGLEKAKSVGIISGDLSIEEARKTFEDFSLQTLHDQKAPGTLSSFVQLLDKSGLNGEDRRKFEEIYFSRRGSPSDLWQMAAAKGITSDQIQGLRLQGKLAYLTLNNAALAAKLQQEISYVDNLSSLADRDLYNEAAWKAVLNTIAPDGASLQEVIPPAYENSSSPLDEYAKDLARKVRLSFPSRVVGRMLEKGELTLGEGQDTDAAVVAFIKKGEGLGFELGRWPLETFAKANEPDLFSEITSDPEKIKSIKKGVKKLQRLYQITPSNEALKILLDLGFESAHDVVAFSEDDFVAAFGRSFPSLDEPRLVYRKAQQVALVTYNFFTTTKLIEGAPALHVITPSAEARHKVRNELLKQYPTLETLFGSLDFCECEHCRSVLSPAAYLVDLLRFVEPEDQVWKNFLSKWKEQNQDEDYQKEWTYDTSGEEYKDQRKKPYYALMERRPDIRHLPLTCDNTNTALPYIDLANEILEYYLANDNNIRSYRGHDTSDVTTAELLAEPQNIIPNAYDLLKGEHYPLSLPFDLWLETVRTFFEHFEVPFWRVLQIFYQGNGELFNIQPNAAIHSPTNSVNATVVVDTSGAAVFGPGLAVTYYDISANSLHSEINTITSVGAAGSGGAPDKILITLSGIWTTPPVAGDLLHIVYRNYSLSSIFAEYLGISPSEYDIFTDPDPLRRWFELYGYATEPEALGALKSAKTLARRLDVRYKELTQIVQAGFINPELEKLVLIWKLRLDTAQVVTYFNDRAKPEYATEKEAFEARLSDFDKKYGLTANSSLSLLENNWTDGTFKRILLLRDSSPFCNFDETLFEFGLEGSSEAEKAEQERNFRLVLLKINLFVRLWRRLRGWTIDEADRALQVFLPRDIPDVSSTSFGQAFGNAFRTALLYISHLKSMDEQVKVGKVSRRQKLLTLWSELSAGGKKSLYGELFLTQNVLKNDPVFDSPVGKYLSYYDSVSSQYIPFQWDATKPEDPFTGNVPLKSHLHSMQAAMNLTTDEIEGIMADVNKKVESEPLSLTNVSLIYRYGLLAKALKISVKELISLKRLSGIDPFKSLEPVMPLSRNQDYPLEQTLRFVESAMKIKESGFTLEDLDYLLLHRFSPVGKYRSNFDVVLASMNTIANGIRRIQDELRTSVTTDDIIIRKLSPKLPAEAEVEEVVQEVRGFASSTVTVTDTDLKESLDDLLKPAKASDELIGTTMALIADLRLEYSTITDDLLKQKLALVIPAEAVDKFFGFWKDTIEFSAMKEEVDEAMKLDPTAYEKDGIRVYYDPIRNWQKVFHGGTLTNDKKDGLLGKIPPPAASASEAEKDAYKVFLELIEHIAVESQRQLDEFFEKYFEGFLTFKDIFVSESSPITTTSEEARRHRIFASIQPFVRFRLVRQLIVQTLATNLNADPVLVEKLLTNNELVTNPDTDNPGRLLLDTFTALGDHGIDIMFFDNAGVQIGQTKVIPEVNSSIRVDGNPIKPNGAVRAKFTGYFVVPKPGAYRFFLGLSRQDAEAEFILSHLPHPLIAGRAAKDTDEISEFVELRPGVMYPFSLNIHDLHGGDASLLVQSDGIYKEDGLSQLELYSQAIIERVMRSNMLLTKIIQIIGQLALSEREMTHILYHRSDFENIDLSRLPTIENDSSALSSGVLFRHFLLLADYAGLKRNLSAGTDDLIGVLENAGRTYSEEIATDVEKVKSVHFEGLANLTYREKDTVRELAEMLGFTINVSPLQTGGERGYRVEVPELAKVEKLWRLWEALQVVEKLGVSVKSIVSWATPTPDFNTAKDLRNTVNARYEAESWQRIARSIFDKLRQKKRDSLVTYIMFKEGFERIEQLFEYFLIDPGMEPIVQTSRLRLAISSVQLFIQRCLLNLEKRVHPLAINSKHWQWMKYYRVWEANRKIFLFPENWLEPEFRDDKTHIFQELESSLLQGDVSTDLAEDAFFNYLKKLEELAKLDIVTIFCEEKLDPASNTLHVIGRTSSLPRKYFYRRYASQMWTPWEPVTAEIEGDHIVAVIWRERLHLFWVTFLEKPRQEDQSTKRRVVDLPTAEISLESKKDIEIQLNWSEYYQRQWTTRESSGFENPIRVEDVANTFDKNKSYIFTSIGEDGSLLVNLGPPISKAFRIVSKNEPPKPFRWFEASQTTLYSVTEAQPTKHYGIGDLNVTLVTQRLTGDYETASSSSITQTVIQGIAGYDGEFSIVRYMMQHTLIDKLEKFSEMMAKLHPSYVGNPTLLPDVNKRLFNFAKSLAVRLRNSSMNTMIEMSRDWRTLYDDIIRLDILRARDYFYSPLERINASMRKFEGTAATIEIAARISAERRRFIDPFFYQNELHSFLVEPTLTETTITEWEDWAIVLPRDPIRLTPEDLEELHIEASIPIKKGQPLPPFEPEPVSRFKLKIANDWVTDPTTVLVLDDNVLIGKVGALDLNIAIPSQLGPISAPVSVVGVSHVGGVKARGSVVNASVELHPDSGDTPSIRRERTVNVITSSNMNPVLLRTLGRNREELGGG